MTLAAGLWTLFIALALLVVGLTVLEVLKRHGWRPVDRLADVISYGPRSGMQSSAAALAANAGESMPDMDDVDVE